MANGQNTDNKTDLNNAMKQNVLTDFYKTLSPTKKKNAFL